MAVTEGIQESSREAARRAEEAARRAEAERTAAEATPERVEAEHGGVETIARRNDEAQPTTGENAGPRFEPATQTAAQEHAIRSSFAEERSTDPLSASWRLAGSPAPASPAPQNGPSDEHTVRPGETLSGIASEHPGVSSQDIQQENEIENPDLIYPGQRLTIPGGPGTPEQVEQQVEPAASPLDDALGELQQAEESLQSMQDLAAEGNGAARAELQGGYLQRNVDNAEAAVETAVVDEIEQEAGTDPDVAAIDRVGNEIAQRYANDPAAQEAVREAVGEIRLDKQADEVLDAAEAAGTSQEAITTLGDRYAAASPEVQARIRADSRTGALLDPAVQEANAPLESIPEEIRSGHDVYPPVREALHDLEQLTEGLPPELAGELVERALPAYEEVQQASEGFGIVGGPNGQYSLVNLAGRVADAPGGDALVGRLTALNDNTLGLETALFDGAAPALFIEMERRGQVVMGNSPLDVAISGAEGYLDSQVQGDVERYAELTEELSFLVTNAGAAMTPDQLDRAINEYITAKGPEWEADVEATRQALEQHGENLLRQIEQFHDLPSELAGRQGEIDDTLRTMLEDPAAQTAISMALRQRPELAAGQAGQDLVDTFAELGVTGDDNPMAVSLVGAYLRENVMDPTAQIDLGDPASLQAARDQITDALNNDPQLAQVLDVTPEQLNDVATALVDLVPDPASGIDEFQYANNIARNANNAFDKLDEALGRGTPFNLGFRMSAVAIVGSGLVNSSVNFAEDPTLRNGMDVLLNSARVGVDSAQLVAAMRNLPAGSPAVSGLKAAGRFVHVLGAGMAGVDALSRLGQGDLVGAGLNATVAGGVGYAVFGSSAWAGPIGFGVAAAATLGLFVYDGIRSTQHSNRFQTEEATAFLADTEVFDDEAARVLTDTSGESHSPVPILLEYGRLRGLTAEQTVDWINSIDPDRLTALRDNLHHTLDEIDGDLSRFGETHDDDEWFVRDTEQRPWFAATGEPRPESATQVDAILEALEIDLPRP